MIDTIKPLIKHFLSYAQQHMEFHKPPRLFLRTDSANAQDPLGKTAFYDPDKESITLYIANRHPKDVMRSLSHELVHHAQNCRGDFDNTTEMGEGYAQKDEHLREMEREAYEVGNMCFRDWEDGIKSTIYYEHLQKGENKMSIKDWKNKEMSTLLSEAWGFKFNSLQEFDEFSGNGELQAEGEDEIEELAGAKQAGERRAPHKRNTVPDDEDPAQDEDEEEVVEESPSHPAADREGNRATGRRVKQSDGQRLAEDEEELEEGDKPDFLDLDKDGDKDESMKDTDDSKDNLKEAIAALLRKHLRG